MGDTDGCMCIQLRGLLQMGDTDDLEDIVKYLELEQQFSTKRNRVCKYQGSSNRVCKYQGSSN